MRPKAVPLAVLATAAVFAVDAPPGTELHVRLKTKIAASVNSTRQPVEAVVTVPVLDGNRVVIPAGARVLGEVKERRAAADPGQRALLRLAFNKIVAPDGKAAKLDASLMDVDNARETVDEKGAIVGILASETLAARMNRGIEKVAERYPGLADVLESMKGSFGVREADPDIQYEPGVDMTLRLNKPVDWDESKVSAEPYAVRAIEPAAAVAELVNVQPLRTRAANPPRPSDMTNLLFIGSADQIRAAFEAAGWTTAETLSGKSTMETIRAVMEGRGYKEAPMSVLLLDGRVPDMLFQKQNNTFAQRHHLRIWRRPDTFDDKEVWVCAATHDVAIDFSPEDRTFIHRIDPQIDRERAKVVNDLVFTGRVRGVSLVSRSDVPKDAYNATGDQLITDGRMAVLEF